MKTYRSARELLAEVERVLAGKHSPRHPPLDRVIELLCEGRHYAWLGIYLRVDERWQRLVGAGGEAQPTELALPNTRSKVIVSMRLAGRELGVLGVESERDNAFGPEDRVMLEKVASLLARFLTGRGKYLVRRARESTASQSVLPARGPRSAPAREEITTVAVGEK